MMGMINKDELATIKTSDLDLASTLLCLGNDVIGIDKTDPGHIEFFFRQTSDLEVVIREYFERKVRVEPQEFMLNMRNLRARLHTDV
jgi:hypothetical protein